MVLGLIDFLLGGNKSQVQQIKMVLLIKLKMLLLQVQQMK